jgi:KaiC/GvpD/RAD55 family RecA-like ATPase
MSQSFNNKISLLAPFREHSDSDDPYAAYEAARGQSDTDLPRGGEGPSDGGSGLDQAPRPRRAFGWTSNDGVRGLIKYAANPTKRIPTGLWQIDNMIGGGVGRGEVCVIIGKSGSGKSIVGQNILESNLDVPAVFFSFEMPGTMLLTRSLAMWSNKTHDIVFNQVETNTLDPEMLADWEDSHQKHYFVTRTGLDLAAMSSTLKEAEEQLGERPAIVVIDYMELVAAAGGGETIDNVTSVAQAIKGWAKEEEVACVMLHQTNKSLRHGDAPDEDAARYGGFTEADIVIGVWRPHKWQPKNKGDQPMPQATVEYLRGYFGINLIKNRPKIELQEQGYLVPVTASGRVAAPKGGTLALCQPGGGGPF